MKTSGRQQWNVDFDEGAVRDFEAVKSKEERKAVFNAIDKLRQLGPRLVPPHVKSLAGEADLFELRPRQGNSKPDRSSFARAAAIWSWLLLPTMRRTCRAQSRTRAAG